MDAVDGTPAAAATETAQLARPAEVKRQSPVTTGLTLLRGCYGGFTMLTFLGHFAGIALGVPAVAGFGLLLGTRGLKEERERQLAQRRAPARLTVHRYIDEVFQVVGKESRDLMRQVQRATRDEVTARADEWQRTAADALTSARRASDTATRDRAARVADLEAELARVDALRAEALQLAGGR